MRLKWTFWDILGYVGTFKDILGHHETFWDNLEDFTTSLEHLDLFPSHFRIGCCQFEFDFPNHHFLQKTQQFEFDLIQL